MRVKICGVNSPLALDAAVSAGADMLGFVFFPPSPRALTPADAAALAALGTGEAERVGLFVDPDDAAIEAVLAALPLDVIQLHGAETPERCAAVRARFGLPVMKALGVASPADLDALAAYRAGRGPLPARRQAARRRGTARRQRRRLRLAPGRAAATCRAPGCSPAG